MLVLRHFPGKIEAKVTQFDLLNAVAKVDYDSSLSFNANPIFLMEKKKKILKLFCQWNGIVKMKTELFLVLRSYNFKKIIYLAYIAREQEMTGTQSLKSGYQREALW